MKDKLELYGYTSWVKSTKGDADYRLALQVRKDYGLYLVVTKRVEGAEKFDDKPTFEFLIPKDAIYNYAKMFLSVSTLDMAYYRDKDRDESKPIHDIAISNTKFQTMRIVSRFKNVDGKKHKKSYIMLYDFSDDTKAALGAYKPKDYDSEERRKFMKCAIPFTTFDILKTETFLPEKCEDSLLFLTLGDLLKTIALGQNYQYVDYINSIENDKEEKTESKKSNNEYKEKETSRESDSAIGDSNGFDDDEFPF